MSRIDRISTDVDAPDLGPTAPPTMVMDMAFKAGAVVSRREVLHGRLWLEHPVTVVSDDDGVLAVRLDPGSAFSFSEHPLGPHPWGHLTEWETSTVLQLHRDGDHYSVWKIFELDGSFRHWYVNFEAPIVRGSDDFDTDDHGLDLIIEPDGERRWKDVEDLHHQRTQGRIDLNTVGGVLAAAAEVSSLLDSDNHWWKAWEGWKPPAFG
jgi:hypothetical protein